MYRGKGEECKKLINENRECVTIMPFVSCAGEVVSSQVIFKGHGITSQMVPSVAADKIPHFIVSTTDHGIQDHNSLLDSYKEFNDAIVEAAVENIVSSSS